jgi:hypothetical protein
MHAVQMPGGRAGATACGVRGGGHARGSDAGRASREGFGERNPPQTEGQGHEVADAVPWNKSGGGQGPISG